MNDKRKILFIHPLGVNWMPGQKDMSRIANIMPPIGLCSLAAWLEKHGHHADIHDCYAFPGQDQKIDAYLRTEQPDYVGFSVTTSSFLDAIRIAEKIREAYPRIRFIFGGVHISALGESLMRDYPVIDYGVVGEGEEALLAILDHDGKNLDDVPGVLYREGPDGPVHFTGIRKSRLELDSLPFPDYGKLEGYPDAYKLPIFNYPKGPGTTAISSRGCPYQCSYCDRSVFRRSFRFNSAEYMVDLARHLHERYGIRHINYYDDLFTFNRDRVEAFCKGMMDSGLKMTFNCAARAEHIDRELLVLMKQAGCWMMSLGIETGDPELLAQHRSHSDLDMMRERVGWIKEAGIRAKGLFMLGLPGETEASIDRSMEYILSLPLDEFNLAKFTPFPGSPLYATVKQSGDFDENWELMNCLNFVYVPEGLTRERLEERYHEMYRNYFKRPRILLGYVAMLWKSPESWLRFLGNFKDFMSIRKDFEK
ncbi:MAG: B12-binding domain-containing radical SAM protein [Candidatus Sumerlaeia bacterium]